ncbi:MAG: carboxypeptidase regulatory-like domain-containing protein [Planctomycetes bacterium]|nr:carboxypeptidase regulatory-like domain-containing protein [Planctomycetota bacterium]
MNLRLATLALGLVLAALAGFASTRSFALAPRPEPVHECVGGPMGPALRVMPERIKTIPPALSVGPRVNVLRRGEVLFRLVDTAGAPLADATCEIWRVRTRAPVVLGLAPPKAFSSGEPFAEFETPADPAARVLCKADKSGLVRLPFGPHPADAPRWSSFLFPIVMGCELARSPLDTIAAISKAWRRPHRGGIDVVMRNVGELAVNVREKAGKPLSDVSLIAVPLPEVVDGVETRVYGGAAFAAARAGRRLTREIIKPAKLALESLSIMHGIGASAAKPVTLRYVGDSRIPSLLTLPAIYLAVSDQSGAARFVGLPLGSYSIFVSATGYETSVVEVVMDGKPKKWTVVMAPIVGAPLKIAIAWRGSAEDLARTQYKVTLLPCGCHGQVDGPLDGAVLQWQVDAAGEAGAVVSFTDVPVGHWIAFVALTDADGASMRREDGELAGYPLRFVKTDKPQDVEIEVGPESVGFWKPSLICKGEPTEGTFWLFRRKGDPEWTERQCLVDPATSREQPIALQPGEYECMVETRVPSPFKIERGLTTAERFEIPVRPVKFTVAKDLRRLMDSLLDEGRTEPIIMDIMPEMTPQLLAGFGSIAQPCVRETFFRGLNDISDCETQIPEEGIEMDLPSGIYHWTLHSTIYLDGVIDLRGRLATKVEFSLANLPGVAICRLNLDGMAEDDDWEVEFADLPQLIENLGSLTTGDSTWYESTLVSSAVPVGPGKFLLFAPPGRHYVRISCQDRCFWRVVNVPGDQSVAVPAAADGELEFLNAPANKAVGVAADSNGLVVPVLTHGASRYALAQGEYEITLVHLEHTQIGPFEWRPAIARVKVSLKPSAVVDFAALKFEPFGTLTVRATGRCPAEGDVDWWWLGWWLEGGGQGSVGVEAVGDAAYWRRAYSALEMAATRPVPALETRRIYLPAGEYTVCPWPNAPRSAWRKVTVEPGKAAEVVFPGK